LPNNIRSSALNHLIDVVENGVAPNPEVLFEEFISKQDFGAWLMQACIDPPAFWFDVTERVGVTAA